MRPRKNIVLFSTNDITISLTRMLLQTRSTCKVHTATSIDQGNKILQEIAAAGREVDVVLVDGSWVAVAYQLRVNQVPVVIFGIIPAAAEYVANYMVPSGPAQFNLRLLEAVRMACKRKRGPKTANRPTEKIAVDARQAA